MSAIKSITGLIFILTLIVMAIGPPNLPSFIDIPSLLVVSGGTISGLLLSGKDLSQMFVAIFSSSASKEEIESAAISWRLARHLYIGFGAIGIVIGSILMLHVLDDPAAIGPGIAIALLSFFHGLILGYGICLPLQYKLERRARNIGNPSG